MKVTMVCVGEIAIFTTISQYKSTYFYMYIINSY